MTRAAVCYYVIIVRLSAEPYLSLKLPRFALNAVGLREGGNESARVAESWLERMDPLWPD